MPRKPTGRKPGRPTRHTLELAELICTRIAGGESLRSVCRDPDLPPRETVLRRALRDESGFRHQYEEALRLRAEAWAEELVGLADEALDAGNSTKGQATRVALDARKWCASRLLPKKYGDRAAVDVGGQPENPLTFAALAQKGSRER
jgi:hypothetical protein